MNIFAEAAPYLKDPVILIGLVMFLALLAARQLFKARGARPHPHSSGSRVLALTLNHGFVVGLLIVAAGGYLKYLDLRDIAAAVQRGASVPREVDFGFAELDPGLAVPVPSYKNGGAMVLYSGEEFGFHALADGPIPPIELRAGDHVQLLPGSNGKVKITGPLNQPLPAVLLARGSRTSLPGEAPPRISVKVQVFGVARPK